MRLFCFHHAGGGRTSFHAWKRALGPRFEVVPVEVADRERFATIRHLVDEVHEQLRPALEEPHMFFGHSFGALLAYRLACVRTAEGSRLPRAIILSSFVPPHLPSPISALDHLDDHQLGALLTDLGGMPLELTRWPVLRDRAIATTRIDLRLCMTDDDAETVTLSCPIHAIGGSDDPLVSEDDLHQWRSRTSADFSVQILRGGHFYLSDRQELFAALRPVLSAAGSAA